MGDQPVHVATDDAQVRPRWRFVGPGLVVAATGVGAADLVATLVAGARYGYALLWVAVLGAILKVILVEAAGRYSLATERSIFEGWRSLGRWTTWYFAPYIVIWGSSTAPPRCRRRRCRSSRCSPVWSCAGSR